MSEMMPLVLVHGFMGGSAQWRLQEPLSVHFDLVTVDLPGFGINADLPVINSIVGFSEWVLDELQRRGVSRFHLLGHSMGGMIVQEMVRLAPDRVDKLVLYGTGPSGVLPGRFETIETSKRRAQEDGVRATARRISATWFLDLEAAAEYDACANIACQSDSAAISAGLDAMKNWTGEQGLSRISHETLIIWGDDDRTYAWPQIQKLWNNIPNTHLAVIPKCAHAVHLEEPEIFNDILQIFINE
jgi:2-hydroxy-6-oxonona-2,4-dienedioate hydrolase